MERARNPEQKAMRREKNQRRRRRSRESTEKQSSGHFPPTCCTTTSDGQFFNRSTQVRQSKPNERVLDLSLPDLSKLIGEEWKNMSDDSKNVSLFRHSSDLYIGDKIRLLGIALFHFTVN